MIKVKITEEMLKIAEAKSAEMGKLKNSIEEGEGNLPGFIGEQAVNKILKGRIVNTYDYDLITDETWEIKTKKCTSPPKSYYECSVAAFNTKQKCDNYVFVRVNLKTNEAWILGWMKPADYYAQAKKMKKGEIDPSNNFTVKSDCYNLRIDQLHQFDISEEVAQELNPKSEIDFSYLM